MIHIRFTLYFIATFLIGLSSAFAQELRNPYFYSIEKNGKTSYILGTMHIGVDASDLPNYVQHAAVSSQTIATEINYFSMSNEVVVTDQTPAKNQLNQHEWQKLVILASYLELTEADISHLSPYTLARTLNAQLANTLIAFYETEPMDHAIASAMKEQGKTIVGLENEKERAEILKFVFNINTIKDDYLSNFSFVNSKADYLNRQMSQINSFIIQYKNGNVLVENNNAYTNALLVERNKLWLNRIINLHTTPNEQLFIAVGLLHLIGTQNILDLLKAEGFIVTHINSEQAYIKSAAQWLSLN